jgi:hypothetical protein
MSTVGMTPKDFAAHLDREWKLESMRKSPKVHWMKDVGGIVPQAGWVRDKWAVLADRSYPKVYVYERLRLVELRGSQHHSGGSQVGDIVDRLGYWTVAKNGHWWWGQSAPMFRKGDLETLMSKVKSFDREDR